MSKKGFTLIELLIVVAIIAILAAIAVPNFLEAQTRSKVARVKADFRSLATALEAFRVDHNTYPPFWGPSGFHSAIQDIQDPLWTPRDVPGFPKASLTSPIAYISSPILDPFLPNMRYIDSNNRWNISLQYGRDDSFIKMYDALGPLETKRLFTVGDSAKGWPGSYDATNGTRSNGDLMRMSY